MMPKGRRRRSRPGPGAGAPVARRAASASAEPLWEKARWAAASVVCASKSVTLANAYRAGELDQEGEASRMSTAPQPSAISQPPIQPEAIRAALTQVAPHPGRRLRTPTPRGQHRPRAPRYPPFLSAPSPRHGPSRWPSPGTLRSPRTWLPPSTATARPAPPARAEVSAVPLRTFTEAWAVEVAIARHPEVAARLRALEAGAGEVTDLSEARGIAAEISRIRNAAAAEAGIRTAGEAAK